MSNLREAAQQALDEIECDLRYLFGRASSEGHESGQRLAMAVRKKMRAARAALAQPDDKEQPSVSFEDIRVQKVYEILCRDDAPPTLAEHWEGYLARQIVDALFGDKAQPVYHVTKHHGYAEWEPTAAAFKMPDGRYPLYTAPQPPAERLTVPSRTPEMNAAVRKVLKHHGLTEHGDGVVEADLIEAVLACLPASAVSPAEQPGDRVQPVAREGWRHVPTELTSEMVDAWQSAFNKQLRKRLSSRGKLKPYAGKLKSCEEVAYAAMLEAAPQPPAEQDGSHYLGHYAEPHEVQITEKLAEQVAELSDEQIKEGWALLEFAAKWLNRAPHGDNCFVSDHYEGDPGDRCNCGKDSLLAAIEASLEARGGAA